MKNKECISYKTKFKKIISDQIIESLYFDTKKLDFFNLSEEGVTPRLKVRIRGYDKDFK